MRKRYLLDTNAAIGFLRGHPQLTRRIGLVQEGSIALSVIVLAELCFGAELAEDRGDARQRVDAFAAPYKIIPIGQVVSEYARQRARLRSINKLPGDFDLLIGAMAIYHDLTLVTRNAKHFGHMDGIRLADWSRP